MSERIKIGGEDRWGGPKGEKRDVVGGFHDPKQAELAWEKHFRRFDPKYFMSDGKGWDMLEDRVYDESMRNLN